MRSKRKQHNIRKIRRRTAFRDRHNNMATSNTNDVSPVVSPNRAKKYKGKGAGSSKKKNQMKQRSFNRKGRGQRVPDESHSSKKNEGGNVVAAQCSSDDVPTSSGKLKTSPDGKFKKFSDNLHRSKQIRKRKLKRLNYSKPKPSAGQTATKKLLQSIKRRQWQQHITPQKRRSNTRGNDGLRRKLNFVNNESAITKTITQTEIKTPKVTVAEVTVEEGEIVSDDNDEDDCVCIEPTIDQITIDDDTPSFRSIALKNASTKVHSPTSKSKLLASTPCFKLKPRSTTAPGSPSYADVASGSSGVNNADQPLLFFEDVSRSRLFESIISDDTFANYTKLTTLRNPTNKRRSLRLNDTKAAAVLGDVIVLDETFCNDITLIPNNRGKKRKSSEMDDSVVFVSETNPNQMPFIPLQSDDVPNPIKLPRKSFTPKKKRSNDNLFTNSEKKQLDAYNDNAYNPDAGAQAQSKKRMVIIDGSNVAFNHALNKEFSVRGLKICIAYFEKMGHEVKAIVPQFRLQRSKSTEPEELEKMHSAGKIVFTPCKNLPGKSSTCYDDRFVLQLACELDAAVVSNDNYRDLINENTAFKKVIENRVIGYTWCNDIFIIPKDPYGKWGPTLHTILNRD